jgi:TolA-binding protein
MPSNNNIELAEDLAKSLQATISLMQNLLGEIHDNATTLAVLNERLESLNTKVESLSHIVKDGNGQGSLVTRLTLIEKDLTELDEKVDGEVKAARVDKEKIEEYDRQKKLGIWKFAAVAAPGIVALIIEIIKALS